MSREHPAYRDVLEDLHRVFGERNLLNYNDVRKYTGLKDNRAVKRRYPMEQGYIAMPVLARCLCRGEVRS